MKIANAFYALSCAALLSGCELFDYHPYCVDISGARNINATNIDSIYQRMQGRTSFTFALVSDTQRWYDETEDFVKDVNSRDSIDFVVHAGDLTDFGVNDEFLWQRDILEKLDVPYVALIGNHDCLGTGKQSFSRIWGEVDFAFTAGDVRFLCLNTNALEYDYSKEIPNMSYIEEQLDSFPSECTRTIVVAHCRPYDEQFNNNLAKYYHFYVTQFPGVMCGLSGHVHKITHEDIFEDGFIYHSTTCMSDRAYLIFSITDTGYTYEEIYF